jgi:hypothetical protein
MHQFHLSAYDIRFYIWAKYSNNIKIKERLDTLYYEMILGDAFRMKDFELAKNTLKNLKKESVRISLKPRVKYLILLLIQYLLPIKPNVKFSITH